MAADGKTSGTPWWKYVLAAVGAAYAAAFLGWGIYALTRTAEQRGPSELAMYPERQDELIAQRQAEAMRAEYGLSDEQVRQAALVMREMNERRREMMRRAVEEGALQRFQDRRQMLELLREKMRVVLTPDQYAKFEEKQTERILGALGALKQAGITQLPTTAPASAEERRDRVMRFFRPVTPSAASGQGATE